MKNYAVTIAASIQLVAFSLSSAEAQNARAPQGFGIDVQAREPVKVFDNLYFVGTEFVATLLITTSDGLILIDTLFDMPGYEEHLFGGIEQLGFDPGDLRYVIITHGHRDHYGLSRVLQDRTDAVIGAAAADWDLIENDLGSAAPARDWEISQGETLTLGDTTLRFDITPGHTPGVVSMEFDVVDGENRHKAYLHGGSAARTNERAGLEAFIDGFERAKAIENIEVRLSTHPFLDDFFARYERLSGRGAGDPHPFVDPAEFYTWADGIIATTRATLEDAQ